MNHIKIYLLAFAALLFSNFVSAQDCTDVHFTLHSNINNGGSPQVVYSITDYPMTTSLESGQANFTASNSNFELDLCLEDGCYTFTVDNNHPVTLGQNIQLEITSGETNYMLDAEVLHQDAISFSILFCIGEPAPVDCEAIFEAATLSFEIEEGTTAGQYHFTNTSSEIENVQWEWVFGDDQYATTEDATHTYSEEGGYEVCLIAHVQNCASEVCQLIDFSIEECNENLVHFNLHSDVNNGGSNQLIYSVFQEGANTSITSGAAQYSASNNSFEFDLCLPDGCYTFMVDNNHPIVLGQTVQLEITSGGNNLMTTSTILHQDPVSFSIQFGVNSNCTEEPVDCTPTTIEVTNHTDNPALQTVTFVIVDVDTEDIVDLEDIHFEEGAATITLNYCFPDGCIAVGIFSDEVPFQMNEDFTIEVVANGQSVVLAEEQEDEYTYGVLVGINSNCTDFVSECEGEFEIVATQNPGEFQFINTSPNVEGIQWTWEFGDGHYSTSPNPTYQFNTNGQYEVCLYGYTPTCNSSTCTLITVEGMVCAENLVSFTLHSDVNNGGSDELYYSVIDNATNQPVTMGIVEYTSGNANFDFQLCLPDGCYSFVVDNDNNITLGEGTELEINSNGNNLMTNAQIIHQDPISFGVLFSVNSDCSVGINEHTTVVNSVFPNPANDNLTIQSKGKSNIERVEILDMKGTLIHAYNPNSQITTLPVSHLATGMYFVKIINKDGIDIQRFNVIH